LSATREGRTLTKQIGRESRRPAERRSACRRVVEPRSIHRLHRPRRGVDHALCARHRRCASTSATSRSTSPRRIERPVRTPEHFRNAIGRTVTLRTPERKKLKGEVVSAGQQSVVVRSGDDTVEIPYDQVVRGNLVYEQ
jgi:hypothetical protein